MDARTIRIFTSWLPMVLCVAGASALLSSTSVRAADEDVFRKMLEGNGAAGGGAASAKPKAIKPTKPVASRESCDQKFATLKASVEARDNNFTQVCFYQERCSWSDKCSYSKVVYSEYGKLKKIASSCKSLTNSQEWAAKYAKWEASTVGVIEYNCRPR